MIEGEISKEEESQRVRLEIRNPLQIEVFKLLDIAHDPDAVIKYSPIIHDIIDNPEHVEIRKIIMNKDIDLAAKMIADQVRAQEKGEEIAA